MRIVTRPDFDGVVCAVLISDALDIHLPVQWLQPNDFQKGLADIRAGDIVANLPFHPNCELWFDHHATNTADRPFQGLFREAPSAASLVLEYFKPRLKRDYTELVHWADRVDSADFTQGMVLQPEKYDYVLLSMTVSGEDGDGEPYWNRLVALLREKSMRDVMADPEVAERCRTVVEQNARYADVLEAHTRIEQHVSITDLRGLDRSAVRKSFFGLLHVSRNRGQCAHPLREQEQGYRGGQHRPQHLQPPLQRARRQTARRLRRRRSPGRRVRTL